MGKVREKLPITVLYAEDEAVTRTVFCSVLATKVKTVYEAANGIEGLGIFTASRPDVVIIDSNMPKMDGLALAMEVRSIAPATPIIMVSGAIKKRVLQQVDRMNISYFKKPLRIRELLALLEKLAGSAGAPAHLRPSVNLHLA